MTGNIPAEGAKMPEVYMCLAILIKLIDQLLLDHLDGENSEKAENGYEHAG